MFGKSQRAIKLLQKHLSNWSINDVPPELVQEMVDNDELDVILDKDPQPNQWEIPDGESDDDEPNEVRPRETGFSVNAFPAKDNLRKEQLAERRRTSTAEFREILLEFLRKYPYACFVRFIPNFSDLEKKFPHITIDSDTIMASGCRPHGITFTGKSQLAKKLISKSLMHWPLKEVTPMILRQMLDDGEFVPNQSNSTRSTLNTDETAKAKPPIATDSTTDLVKSHARPRKRRPVSEKLAQSPAYQHKQRMIAQWRMILGKFIGRL